MADSSNNSASFGAYQTDPFTHAYISVLGAMLAFRLGGRLQNKLIPELLKSFCFKFESNRQLRRVSHPQ